MADYYKNSDYIKIPDSPDIYGIQYHIDEDDVTEPVDPEFFKKHARIDFNVDDELIGSYITAARQELEAWAQKSFAEKTIKLTALKVPENYRLMHGPVKEITTDGYTHLGDILKEGGTDVEIEYTTKANTTELIRVAISRYAAGLYAIREHITTDEKGNPVNGENIINEAKESLRPIMNKILF